MLWERDGGDSSIVILVVDDSKDDALTAVLAKEQLVPNRDFGGAWGTGQEDGHWLIAFLLVERGGGLKREWYTSNIHRPLLEGILDVPHLVAILPKEIAGDARTQEEIAPRLASALIVAVEDFSEPVAEVLAERDD